MTLLAFDYGLRRTGVATGESVAGLTRGITTLHHTASGEPDWSAIDALLRDWQPDRLVVGLPVNADGSASAITRRARRFAQQLAEHSGLPVDTVDERLSSSEARARLRQQRADGWRRRLRRGDIDREAASIIARQWLNQHRDRGQH